MAVRPFSDREGEASCDARTSQHKMRPLSGTIISSYCPWKFHQLPQPTSSSLLRNLRRLLRNLRRICDQFISSQKSPTNFLPVHFFSDETSRCLQLDTTVLVVSDSPPPPRTTTSLWSPTASGTASRVQSSYTTLSARPSALGPTPKSRQRGVHTSGKW